MYEVDTKALRTAMAENEINSISKLSAVSGISRVTLSKVLSGDSFPSSAVMKRLADALHLDGERAGRIFFAPKLT